MMNCIPKQIFGGRKAKTATLTPSGVKKQKNILKVENLLDSENITLQHHINQAIKAHGVMQKILTMW